MDRNSKHGNVSRDGGYIQEDFSAVSSEKYVCASRGHPSKVSSDGTSGNSQSRGDRHCYTKAFLVPYNG